MNREIHFICSGVVSTPFAAVVVCDARRSCHFFSSMRSIACLSYRITSLNITSCGCKVQTYGVQNAVYGVRQSVLSSSKYSTYGISFPVPAQACTTADLSDCTR